MYVSGKEALIWWETLTVELLLSLGQGSVAGILVSKAFNANAIMAIRVKQKNTEGNNKMKV